MGVADIEKAIIHDPALVAVVIRASNSAQYRSPRMVTNLRDAVVRMGMQQVFSVMVASTVVRGLQVASPRGHGLLQQLWKTAMLTGELGRCIAESEQLPRPEELYLAALLHNLGEMVLVWRHFQQGGGESPQAMHKLGVLVARASPRPTSWPGTSCWPLGASPARSWGMSSKRRSRSMAMRHSTSSEPRQRRDPASPGRARPCSPGVSDRGSVVVVPR